MAKKTKEELVEILSLLNQELKDARNHNDEYDHGLKYTIEGMQEKLYEHEIEPRPTIMQTIIDKEAELVKTIKYMIKNCEKETGRKLLFVCKVDDRY